MSIEAIALAVLNAVRPGGIAATYALVSTDRPRTLLGSYLAVGFAWSALLGIIIVSFLGEVDIGPEQSTISDLIDLIAGAGLVGFAAGLASGRIAGEAGGRAGPSRLELRLREPSVAVAAGAGVITHLPGLLYLLGLNAILAGEPALLRGVIQVLIFNAIWFSVPITAFVISIRDPARTRRALAKLTFAGRTYGRGALIVLLALVGTYFALRGALDLAG